MSSKIESNKIGKDWFQKITAENGDVSYIKNTMLHREDGPAIEWAHGAKSWYYLNRHIPVDNQEDFERYLKVKSFW